MTNRHTHAVSVLATGRAGPFELLRKHSYNRCHAIPRLPRPRPAVLVIGIGASFGVAQFVETLLFNLVVTDNTMVALAAVALAAAAGVAGYLPARRAAPVDPMVALREN